MASLGVDTVPGHGALERRRRARADRPGQQAALAALPRRRGPALLPAGQLGPLRPPGAQRRRPRHGRLLRRHRTGPAWCCAKPPRSQANRASTWMPKPTQFKLFVEAVGKRYSGRFRDENARGKPRERYPPAGLVLVAVETSRTRALADAAVVARPRVLADAVPQPVHQGPRGPGGDGPRWRHHPARRDRADRQGREADDVADGSGDVHRALFCVDDAGNRPATASAATRSPRTVRWRPARSPTTPTRRTSRRWSADPNPDIITMANLGTLTGLLDRIADKTGRSPAACRSR